ncbi:bifunctional tetrahydrofolate synthase/dihydrofolate synthase [Methylomicrobium sp. Wu6]|uniref:bifunctional tetrahydrofolate synthase/dihydrofolate synthase n=1 Tax=Methylomicrobium sp. Wu6 TaxID=3107928 RepID=UPI002DD63073|nr:bifunctional tetrahydrofolate synthase/dihydrofolate synthase [Methylomicrobium sp. Wu6]MEC4748318.1 bifunctional tetrahydrofolate synthase/dihydrofolate synthase [Methylomicrobium sp. Wu6]
MPRFNTLKEWLNWQESLHPLAIDLGLERVARVFDALAPDYRKPVTITVAGTNGKGSCVAYLETIYRTQGYKVGAYTSPHILRYNERIKIDGNPAADELICEAFARIETVRQNISLSYFEFSTLAALDIFSRSAVDVQILEVGMGGRLDAVNIVDPDVALISSIGIDHVDWLGQTREAIGAEKAGIFRAATPAIVGDPEPPVSLIQCAQDKHARLFCIGKEFGYQKTTNSWNWRFGNQRLENLPPPALKGEHQYRNASSAILAVKQLSATLPVDIEAIRQGLENVKLAGRFQLIDGKIPLLLDVGHNPEAVKTLVAYLREHCQQKRVRALFSMMKDKDIKSVLELMSPLVYDWFFAPLTNPRAANEAQMRAVFEQCGIATAHFGFQNFNEAFAAAKNQLQEGDLLLVFGSFFLVSDCLSALDKGK